MNDVSDPDAQRWMGRAIDCAEEARDRGDDPFGSVIVADGEIVMEARNAVVTDNDVRSHPELRLAARAISEYEPTKRATMSMYTSTEPCPMCAGGLRYTGLERIVYSVSLRDFLVDIRGQEPLPVDATDILTGVSSVDGPVLPVRGYELLDEFYTE